MRRIDMEMLAHTIVAAYRDQIEAYARLPESVLAGRKLAAARASSELFARLATEDRNLAESELEDLRHAIRLDVDDGIPLSSALRACLVAGAVTWRAIATVARPDESTGLLVAMQLHINFTESVSATVCDVYAAERGRPEVRSNRIARAALEALIRGTVAAEQLARLAAGANLRLAASYAPFVARSDSTSTFELALALRKRGMFAVHNAGDVVGVVQSASDERALEQSKATFAVGLQMPREQLARAVDDLRLLVDIAARTGLRRRVHDAEFLLERSLARAPAIDDALERVVVAPLAEHDAAHGSELVRTLRSFVDNGLRRKLAAQKLHIHPNTLDCRLARIRHLTSLDLGRPEDLAQVVVAVSRHRLRRDRTPA